MIECHSEGYVTIRCDSCEFPLSLRCWYGISWDKERAEKNLREYVVEEYWVITDSQVFCPGCRES